MSEGTMQIISLVVQGLMILIIPLIGVHYRELRDLNKHLAILNGQVAVLATQILASQKDIDRLQRKGD